jgi:hypothetical protein
MIFLLCGVWTWLKAVPIEIEEKGKKQLLAKITCVCEDAKYCPKPDSKLTTGQDCFTFHLPKSLRDQARQVHLPKNSEKLKKRLERCNARLAESQCNGKEPLSELGNAPDAVSD